MDQDITWAALDEERTAHGDLFVVQGGCATGADMHAREWCFKHGLPCATVSPAWKYHGNAAGPIRNRWMLDLLKPDRVIAFPGGAGTRDCVRQAMERGISMCWPATQS